MKLKHTILPCAAVVVLFGIVALASADKPIRPPSKAQLADAWVGFDGDNVEFYRLELDADGKGVCAVTLGGQDSVLWSVGNWDLKGFEVQVNFKAIGHSVPLVALRTRYSAPALTMEVADRAKPQKWRAKLLLYRESKWQELASQTKRQVEQVRAQAKGK